MLTRRTVRQYVVQALYAGPDVAEGTPAYDAFERRLYRDIDRAERLLPEQRAAAGHADRTLDPESTDYLRRVLATAAGDSKRGLSRIPAPFDGFSSRAYHEVYGLLGSGGRSYLGLRGARESLVPSRWMVYARLVDEDDAEAQRRQSERRAAPMPFGVDQAMLGPGPTPDPMLEVPDLQPPDSMPPMPEFRMPDGPDPAQFLRAEEALLYRERRMMDSVF